MPLTTFLRVIIGVFLWFMLVNMSFSVSTCIAGLKSHKSDIADVVFWSFLLIVAIAAAIALCVEMLVHNPHYGIYMQVSLNAFAYSFACVLGFTQHEECKKINSFFEILTIVFLIASVPLLFVHPAIPEIYTKYNDKEFSVEREVLESKDILSANDAYEIKGGGNLLIFAVDTNGCYRYYYRGDDGSVEQGEINTSRGDKLYDDCTEDGEAPRIEKVRSYEGSYVVHNMQVTEHIESMRVWDELHVPKGSIAYDFTFDLQ